LNSSVAVEVTVPKPPQLTPADWIPNPAGQLLATFNAPLFVHVDPLNISVTAKGVEGPG